MLGHLGELTELLATMPSDAGPPEGGNGSESFEFAA